MLKFYKFVFFLFNLFGLILSASNVVAQCSFTNLNSTYCANDAAFTLTGGTNYYGPGVSGTTFNPGAAGGAGTYTLATTDGLTSTYNVNTSGTFNPVSIPAPTAVTIANNNSIVVNFPTGFSFGFFGSNFTAVRIYDNGFIRFAGTGGSTTTPQSLPDPTMPNSVLAFAWGDLDPTTGTIEYGITGTAPTRVFLINFTNVQFASSTEYVTAQIQLHEKSNIIEIHSTHIGSTGGNKTFGIENTAGSVAYVVTGRNKAVWTANNDFVSFVPSCSEKRSVTIAAVPSSNLAVFPSTYSICSGNAVPVTVGNSELNVEYQLQDNADNTPLSGFVPGTGSNLTINSAVLSSSTTIKVFARNVVPLCSLDLTNKVAITVFQSPTTSAAGVDQNQCTNGVFTLAGNAPTTGSGAWSLQSGTALITNSTLNNTTVTGVPVGTSATLRWTISNGVCTASTDDVIITNYAAPTTSAAGIDQNQCTNGVFTLAGNVPTTGSGSWSLQSGTALITNSTLNNTTVTGIPVGTSATLRWTISNGVCTASTDDVIITNYAAPTTSAAGIDQNQCTNGVFTLAGNVPTTGSGAWSLQSGTALITNATLNNTTVTGVPVGTSATLRWTISNGVCTASTDDVIITNYAAPTTSAAGIDQNQCTNGVFTLAGNVPTTGSGSWSLQSGTALITNSTLNNTTVTGIPVGTSATLRWTISNGVCTASTDDVIITNYAAPTTSAAGIDQNQCTNGVFTLAGNVPTTGSGTWSLQSGTALITNSTLNNTTVTGIPVGTSATLRWTISNGVCTASTDDVIVTNYAAPTISAAGIDQNQCTNGVFTLAGNAPTTGSGTWSLQSGTALITNSTLNNTTVTGIPVGTSATLRWTISNGVCTASTDDVIITNYAAPTTSAAGIDQNQCTNGVFTLAGNVPTTGSGTWSLQSGTALITNSTLNNTTVTGIPVGTSATLRWTISNGVCTASTDDVIVTNYNSPTASAAGIDQNQCTNGVFTLAGNVPTTGSGTWSLQSGTALITNSTLNNTTVTGVPVGTSATLRWTISNGVCTASTDDVIVTNYAAPTTSAAGVDQNQCTNGVFTLAGNVPTTGSGAWSLQSGTALITNSTLNNTTVTGIPVGTSATLRWTISNGVCTASTDDVIVTNYNSPTISAAGIDQNQCTNGVFTLAGNVPTTGSGAWSLQSGTALITNSTLNNTTVTGVPVGTSATLRWTISNGVCTASTDDVIVTNYNSPTISAAGIDQNQCTNGVFTLAGNVPTTGSGAWSLQSGTALITNATLNNTTVTGVPVGTSATLRWTISNGVCTASTDDVIVTNYAAPTTSAAGIDQNQCTNGVFTLAGNVPTTGSGSWSLQSGTALITNSTLNNTTVTGVPVGTSATLRWTISNGVCTASTDDVIVTNYNSPTISAAGIDQNQCTNGVFTLAGNVPTTGSGAWSLQSGTALITNSTLNNTTVTGVPVGTSATLRWTISNGVCTASTDDVIITNYAAPTTSAAGIDQNQCTNGVFTLAGNVPTTGSGSWSLQSGTALITNSTLNNTTVTGIPVGTSATLRWTISNGVCTASTDDVIITNYAAPTTSAAGVDQNQCTNGVFTLAGNVPTTGSGAWSLQSGTALITNATLNNTTVTGVPVGTSATLRWTISNGVCTASTDDVIITNYAAPTTSAAGVDQNQCTNGVFTLAGNVPTTGSGTWSLQSGTALITNATLNNTTVTGVPVGTSATLRWTISNGVCTASTDDVIVTNYNSPTISAAGIDQNQCTNGVFTLAGNVPTTGSGAWSLQSGTALITNSTLNNTTVTGIPVGTSATLRWTISNGVCTASTDDVIVTNYAAPTASAAGIDQNQCTNGVFTLAGNVPTTGSGAWSLQGGTALITNSTLNNTTVTGIPVGTSATLRWTISNGVCTASTDDVIVTNYAAPTISAAGIDQNQCTNGVFTLAGNVPTTGSGAWSLQSGTALITNSTLNNTTVTGVPVGTSATLRWTISNGVCTASTDDVIVTNYAAPTTSAAGVDQNQCTNGVFTLAGNVPTTGSGSWSLQSGTALITNSTLNNTTVTGVPVGTSATLRWTISNGVCTASTDDVIITNYAAPTTSAAGIDQNQCTNGVFTLAGNVPTTGSGTWSLQSGTALITNSTLNNTTVTGVPVGTSATLRWTISNGVCTASTDDVIVTNYAAPTTSAAGVDQNQCTNGVFTLSGNVPTTGSGSWSLQSGTALITNSTLNNTTVTGVPVGTSATLRWTISNGVCTASTDDVIVTNYNSPTVANAGADQSNCGTNASLNATPATLGIGNWSVVSGVGGSFGVSSSPTSSFSGTSGNTYVLRWTIVNGVCSSQDDVQIILKRIPDVNASGQTICNGQSTSIAITNPNGVPGTTFSWTIASNNNVTGGGVGDGSFINQNLSNTDGQTQGQIQYRITPMANSCAGSFIDIAVLVNPVPVIINSPSSLMASVCSGTALNFLPNSSISSTIMTWTSTNSTTGTGAITETLVNNGSTVSTVTYTITPSVGLCSGQSVSYVVNVKPLPSVTGTNDVICSGTNTIINLLPTPKNVSGTTFSWVVSSSSNITGAANGNGSQINQLLSSTNGVVGTVTYHVTPTAFGCNGPVKDILVTIDPVATVDAGPDYSVCEPGSIPVSGIIGGGASSGTWKIVKGNGSLTPSSSGTTVTSTYTVNATDIGNYIVLRLETNDPDLGGPCTFVTDDVRIDIHRQPVVSVPANYIICEPTQIDLTGTVSGSATAGTWGLLSGSGTLSVSSVTVNGASRDVTAIYYPGASDVGTVVKFRLTTDDPDGPGALGPCVMASADLSITINQSAKVNAGTDFEVCEDGIVQLNGSFSGAAVSVKWSESSGTGAAQFSDITNPITTYALRPYDINNSPITFKLTTNDPAGPCLAVSDNVVVTINKLPIVALTNLNSIYQEDDAVVTMAGFPSGPGNGVYTGPGVVAGTNKFDPSNANIGLNTIVFTYTDIKGCTNSISKTITVNSLTSIDFGIVVSGSTVNNGIGLPEIEVCANIGIARLRGVPKYTDGLTPTVDTYFKGVISSPLINVLLDASGYYINTTGLSAGEYYIQYTFKDPSTTATSSLTKKIIVKEAPVAIIGATDHCIDSPVQFTDLSTPSAIITSWVWDFDDGGTQSNVQNPVYDYSLTQPRSHLITLKVTTDQGCSNVASKSITIGSPPIPDFNWTKLCSGDATRFSNMSSVSIGTIDGYGWDFDDGNVTSISMGNIIPPDDNGNRTGGTYKEPKHKYGAYGDYNVTLSVRTSQGCVKNITKRIYILNAPSIAPIDGYYSESFPSDVSSWINTNLSSSWVFGPPNGEVINSAYSNKNAWWTGANLNKDVDHGTYYNNEKSEVIGPCLNLSAIKRPMLSLHYWSDLQVGFDGAVVQYSTDGAQTWKTIGDAGGGGIDWYNSKNLSGAPGNQESYAWSESNTGWRNARFNLDQIPHDKRDTVVFRVAFGSNNDNLSGSVLNGFAFDDIYIGEKQKNVLVEHFANVETLSAAEYLDNLFYDQTDPNQTTFKEASDFTKIQYHIASSTKIDSINQSNPNDPAARSFYYGVSQPPFTIMDGILGYFGDYRDSIVLNGDHALITAEELDRRALEDPLFDIAVTFSSTDDSRLKADLKITYLDSMKNLSSTLVLHAALIEDHIGTNQNVVKKLLPSVEGAFLAGPWTLGQTTVVPIDYKSTVHITNPDDLDLVVFIQDRQDNSKRILQSYRVKAPRIVGPQIVGLPDNPSIAELSGLSIYPNPANHFVNFELGSKISKSYTWKMLDQRGVIVLSGKLQNDLSTPQRIDVSGLANAMYIIVLGNETGDFVHYKVSVMNGN